MSDDKITGLIPGLIWCEPLSAGTFFYRKSTTGTITAAIDANNDTYFLQNRIEKFPLGLRRHENESSGIICHVFQRMYYSLLVLKFDTEKILT